MIQLVRHQFSRKRDSCFSGGLLGEKDQDASEDADLFEIIRDNQLNELCLSKSKSAAEIHLDELRLNCDA